MIRSMMSGISGLRNHQTAMDVIGNNISNVNTTGFKASRVTFSSVFTKNKVASNLVGTLYTDSYVFAGYRSSTVQFSGTKTLDTVSYKYNYTTV